MRQPCYRTPGVFPLASLAGYKGVEWIGRPYNELLITLMYAMGMAPSEWESGNVPGFGDYSRNFNNQYALGDQRSPLPAIVKG
jgi:hypothetical protein